MRGLLCGFGKKKSSKDRPYEKSQSNDYDELGWNKQKVVQKPIIMEHNIGKQVSSDSKLQGVNGIDNNSNLDQPINKSNMTSEKQELAPQIQNGGKCLEERQDKIIKQTLVKTGDYPRKQSSEFDGEFNRKTEESYLVIHSFKEAQDIEKLSEQIMSGEKITSIDILGRGAQEQNGFSKIYQDVPGSQVKPIEPLPDYETKKEYITADQMKRDDFYYKMNHAQRGKCIIINVGEFLPTTRMQNRNGYLVDGELMKGTFTRLGFDVQYVKNPTSLKLKRALEEASLEDHKDVDCFAMVIMSHGNRDFGDLIFTRDGIMHLDFIMEYFNGRGCPQLAGKPKLFFIQACRGDKLDDGQELAFIDEDADELDAAASAARIPIEADILLSQATSSGYISFRNSQKGSIYIRCLTKALSEHAYDEDILSILTRVNAMVAFEFESNSTTKMEYHAKKQMPTFTCQLTRKLQFHRPKGKAV